MGAVLPLESFWRGWPILYTIACDRHPDLTVSVYPVTEARSWQVAEGARLRAVVGPHTGAQHRSMHVLELEAGAAGPVWRHESSEAAYYVVSGEGTVVDMATGERHAVRQGNMWYVSAGTPYRIQAGSGSPFVCAGGPCPPDPTVYPRT